MKSVNKMIYLILLVCTNSCGQMGSHLHKNKEKMKTSIITNVIVKQAFEAWQHKDSKAWNALFTAKPVLLDDGNPRDFEKFSTEIGAEYFTSIDKVENDGKDIFGHFHSDTWGDFKTYFKFSIDKNEKIAKLEIGQADY